MRVLPRGPVPEVVRVNKTILKEVKLVCKTHINSQLVIDYLLTVIYYLTDISLTKGTHLLAELDSPVEIDLL